MEPGSPLAPAQLSPKSGEWERQHSQILGLRWSSESFLPPWCGYTLVLEDAYPKCQFLLSSHPKHPENPEGSEESGTVTRNVHVHLESSVLQTF